MLVLLRNLMSFRKSTLYLPTYNLYPSEFLKLVLHYSYKVQNIILTIKKKVITCAEQNITACPNCITANDRLTE